MQTPEEQLQEDKEYEERVKQRVLLLRDYIEQNKVHFGPSVVQKAKESFSKARFDNNGEPDLKTVDDFIRSLAIAVEHFDYREKMKSAISLREIQARYFSIIEANFGYFFELMLKNKSTPHDIAHTIAYNDNPLDVIDGPLPDLIKDIEAFWELLAESGFYHLEDDHNSVKAVYGGDLFPAHNENIASKCGIYTDTIVLPCPIIRSKGLFKIWNKQQRVYFILKHALNILQYKELALADLDKPIVVILPDKEMMNEEAFGVIAKLGEKDALYHSRKVFGREFKSFEEVLEFGKNLDTIEKVIKEIRDAKRVLFDIENTHTLVEQIEEEVKGQSKQLLGTAIPGLIVASLGFGRMSVCNELLLRSAKVGGVPLIDAPTSWEYFKWKLEYDTERTFPEKDFSKLHVLKGLNGLNDTSLQWVGKIPPEGLIELRKSGAINEIREILSKGINELVLADELDFAPTSQKVFNNLNTAFNLHQENIKKLTAKKWKIAGKDFGTWIVVGTVEIASACIGTPLFGISAFVLDQLLDPAKIKELPGSVQQIKNLNEEKKNMKKSPLGLMFKYKH